MKRRRGFFKINMEVFKNENGIDYELVNEIFKNVLVIHVEDNYYKQFGACIYYCESSLFDEIEHGSIVPEYKIRVLKQITEIGFVSYQATFEKVE